MVGAIVYIVESTKLSGYSSFYGAICKATGNAGSTIGIGVIALMRYYLSDEAMISWGWRIPFLSSAVFGVLGMLLRANLVDDASPAESSFHHNDESPLIAGREPKSLWTSLRGAWKEVILTVLVAATWGVTYYSILVWLSYFLYDPMMSGTVYLSKSTIWTLSFIMNIGVVFLMPMFGFLNDIINRGPSFLLTVSCFLFVVFTCPMFILLASGDMTQIVCGYTAFVILISMFG
jgi:MHS family proline/betaine transporter-like MFS transporter